MHVRSVSLLLLLSACNGGDTGGPDCDERTWFLDADGDGHGGAETASACDAPEGFVAQSTDCDDTNAQVNPDAPEVCNGVDDDCDDDVDGGATDAVDLFEDGDGDGFGDAPTRACPGAAGTSEVGGDCDDDDATTSPGAEELCDGVDNDCDGVIDGARYPQDFTGTLAEAVAETTADLLCVAPGAHDEPLVIDGKAVTVRGFGADQTMLSGIEITGGAGAVVGDLAAPSAVIQATAGVTLRGVDLAGLVAVGGQSCEGCVLDISDSEVVLDDVDLLGAEVQISVFNSRFAGLARVRDSTLDWRGGVVTGNAVQSTSTTVGFGLVYAQGSTVRLDSLDFLANAYTVTRESDGFSSAGFSGVLYVHSCDTELVDVAIDDNTAMATSTNTSGGTAAATLTVGLTATAGTFAWRGGSMSGNTGIASSNFLANGALLRGSDVALHLTDVTVVGNRVEGNGGGNVGEASGLHAQGAPFHLTRVDLRDNHLETSGSGGWMHGLVGGYEADGSTLDNVVVAGNTVDAHAVAYGLIAATRYDLSASHVTVTGNEVAADAADSAAFSVEWGALTIADSVVSGNSLVVATTARPAAAAVSWDGRGEVGLRYTDVFENSSNQGEAFMRGPATFDGLDGDGNLEVDPAFASTSGAAAGWDLTLAAGSPLIDAGDPAIQDPDGSRSDVGAYGGPDGAW